MNLSTPARRLTTLLLAAPAAAALTACGVGSVQLSPAQLEAALLTEEDFPLQASAETTAQDTVLLDAAGQGFSDYSAESVDEQCAAALDGVYPADGVPAFAAHGDYATGEQRILVRVVSLPEETELDLEEGFTAVGEACDGQTLADSAGEGLVITALEDESPAGFRQSVADAAPRLEDLLSVLDTHRMVAQEHNNAVEVMGVGLSEAEVRDVLEAQEAKLADTVSAAR